MKYWKLELKYENIDTARIDKVYLTPVICENTFFNSEVMRFPDGSEQLFRSEKAAYSMILEYLSKSYRLSIPVTDNAKRMFADFIVLMEKKYPELII